MTSPATPSQVGGLLVRLALPCAIFAGGVFGFVTLSKPPPEKPTEEAEEVRLRTRVEELCVVDYPVVVTTNAVVQAHDRVTLTAEVAGSVVRVSPSFEVGAYFDKGEVLVEIDPRNYETALAIAEAQLAGANSALELAKVDEERKLWLVESNAVSRAEVDAASATREQAEAEVKLAETRVEQAKLDLERTKVVAPFDGRVQTRLVGLGQMAGTNSPLGDVFAVDFAEVRLPISANQRQYLRLPEFADDERLEVTLRDALVERDSPTWDARIVRTEGVLDQDSRDVFAIARVDDPFGRESKRPPLRIGQPVVASIKGQVLRNVIALPRYGVRQLDQVVLVDAQEHTLLPLSVKPLWTDAAHVVVEAESIPREMLLATTPMTYTPEGSKVEIIPAAGSGPAIADSGAAADDDSVAN